MEASNIQRDLLSNITHSMKMTELKQRNVTSQRTRARNSIKHTRRISGEHHLQENQKEWKKEYIDILPLVKNNRNNEIVTSPIDIKSDAEFEQVMHSYNASLASQRLPPNFINKGARDFRNKRQSDHKRKETKFPNIRQSTSVKSRARKEKAHQHHHPRSHSSTNLMNIPSNHSTSVYAQHHMAVGARGDFSSKKYGDSLPTATLSSPSATKSSHTIGPFVDDASRIDTHAHNGNRTDDSAEKQGGTLVDDKTKKFLKRAKRLSSQFKQQEALRVAEIYSHLNTSCTASLLSSSPSQSTSGQVFPPYSPSSPTMSNSPSKQHPVIPPLTPPPPTSPTSNSHASFTSNSPSICTPSQSEKESIDTKKANRLMTRQLSRQVSQNFSSDPPPSYVRLATDTTASLQSFSQPAPLSPSDIFNTQPNNNTNINNMNTGTNINININKSLANKRQVTRQLSRKFSRQFSRKPTHKMIPPVAATPSYVRLDDENPPAIHPPTSPRESYDVFDQVPVKKITPYKIVSHRQKRLQTGISFGNDFEDQGISCGTEMKRSHMKITIKEPKKHFALLDGQDIW